MLNIATSFHLCLTGLKQPLCFSGVSPFNIFKHFMTRLIFGIVLLLSFQDGIGQPVVRFDGWKAYQKDWVFTAAFNNRRTKIHEEMGTIYGVEVGLRFNDRLENSVGMSFTLKPLGQLDGQQSSYRQAQLLFITVGEEFEFLRYKRFAGITYVHGGYGWSYYTEYNAQEEMLRRGIDRIVPLELGLLATYDVIPWAYIKVGAGWRFEFLSKEEGLDGYFVKLGGGIRIKRFLAWWDNRLQDNG